MLVSCERRAVRRKKKLVAGKSLPEEAALGICCIAEGEEELVEGEFARDSASEAEVRLTGMHRDGSHSLPPCSQLVALLRVEVVDRYSDSAGQRRSRFVGEAAADWLVLNDLTKILLTLTSGWIYFCGGFCRHFPPRLSGVVHVVNGQIEPEFRGTRIPLGLGWRRSRLFRCGLDNGAVKMAYNFCLIRFDSYYQQCPHWRLLLRGPQSETWQIEAEEVVGLCMLLLRLL